MKVSEAVSSRRSVRAFLDKPVDRAVIARVLEKAQRAPSGGNTQPWHGIVLTGDSLQRLFARIAEEFPRAARRMRRSITSIRPSSTVPTSSAAAALARTCTAR